MISGSLWLMEEWEEKSSSHSKGCLIAVVVPLALLGFFMLLVIGICGR